MSDTEMEPCLKNPEKNSCLEISVKVTDAKGYVGYQ